MSSSKEEFHQVMETNVDDAELGPPNTSRNQIAMMYLASEARIKELEDQLEKANETNEKMQRRAAAFTPYCARPFLIKTRTLFFFKLPRLVVLIPKSSNLAMYHSSN